MENKIVADIVGLKERFTRYEIRVTGHEHRATNKSCGFDRHIMFNPLPHKDIRFTIHEIPPTKTIDQNKLILTNKPNFQKTKMNLTDYMTSYYERKAHFDPRQNKPNQTQIENQHI